MNIIAISPQIIDKCIDRLQNVVYSYVVSLQQHKEKIMNLNREFYHGGKKYKVVSFQNNEFTPKISFDANVYLTANELREKKASSSFVPRICINGGLFQQFSTTPEYASGFKNLKDMKYGFTSDRIVGPSYQLSIANYDKGRNIFINDDEWNESGFTRQGSFSLVYEGNKVPVYVHPELYNEAAKRTAIGARANDGTYTVYIVCTDENVTGSELADCMIAIGCKYAVAMDGGGSTSLWVDGETIINSTRKISDAIVFGDEISSTTTGYSLNTTKQAVRIRESLVNGVVRSTVAIGNKLKITNFIPGIQSDGYQWCQSEFNGVKGYSQIDTFNCYTISKTDGNAHPLYITTVGMKMRIRESVVNGRELAMVPQGARVSVVYLVDGIQSDGYQWAYCLFNGVYGYCQIDTAVYTLTK